MRKILLSVALCLAATTANAAGFTGQPENAAATFAKETKNTGLQKFTIKKIKCSNEKYSALYSCKYSVLIDGNKVNNVSFYANADKAHGTTKSLGVDLENWDDPAELDQEQSIVFAAAVANTIGMINPKLTETQRLDFMKKLAGVTMSQQFLMDEFPGGSYVINYDPKKSMTSFTVNGTHH